MLGLKLPTEKRWVELVKQHLDIAMSDHAWAEYKAASTAMSLILQYPTYTALVQKMAELVQEEIGHFQMVLNWIQRMNFPFHPVSHDAYVNELMTFIRTDQGKELRLLDRLLFAAMIEARSCERFKVLTEHIDHPELKAFYEGLMKSEARHYTTFLKLARTYFPEEVVKARWKEYLEYESQVIQKYNRSPQIHG
jgi:tRNA-(ms[2]io[6]A)-hydroxylase